MSTESDGSFTSSKSVLLQRHPLIECFCEHILCFHYLKSFDFKCLLIGSPELQLHQTCLILEWRELARSIFSFGIVRNPIKFREQRHVDDAGKGERVNNNSWSRSVKSLRSVSFLTQNLIRIKSRPDPFLHMNYDMSRTQTQWSTSSLTKMLWSSKTFASYSNKTRQDCQSAKSQRRIFDEDKCLSMYEECLVVIMIRLWKTIETIRLNDNEIDATTNYKLYIDW